MSEELSRRRFLEGCAALLGVSLVGCASGSAAGIQVSSQGGDKWTLENVPVIKSGEAVAFQFAESEPGLLFALPGGRFGAVNAKCTHSGCTVQWTDGAAKGAFHCPCHASEFDLDGKAIAGPAKKPLPRYTATSQGEGKYQLSL